MRFGAGWWHPGSRDGDTAALTFAASPREDPALGVTEGTPHCSRSALHTEEQLLGAVSLQIVQQGPAVGAEREEQRV